jgi:hypothetical protein
LRGAYWKSRSPENEKAVAAFLEPDTIKTIYLHGHPDPTKISPDNWTIDNHFLERPNAKQVQLDFFYDYRTNVELYPKWQAFLKDKQPKTIIFWGHDIFFTKESLRRARCFHGFALRRGMDTITPRNAAAAHRDHGDDNR